MVRVAVGRRRRDRRAGKRRDGVLVLPDDVLAAQQHAFPLSQEPFTLVELLVEDTMIEWQRRKERKGRED